MWKLPAILTATLAGVASAQVSAIWPAADGGNDHRYTLVVMPEGVSWSDASHQAQNMGGHLAAISSAAEHNWVFSNIVDRTEAWFVDPLGFNIGPYIGLYQDRNSPSFSEPSGGWTWVTGEQVSFTAWHPGQPNNVNVQDFGHFWSSSPTSRRSLWQDIQDFDPSFSPRSFVVEIPSDSCPGDIADDFGILGSDGMVSFGDFLALLALIGPCPGGLVGCDGDFADRFGSVGADGFVDFGDFLALLSLVGPCP